MSLARKSGLGPGRTINCQACGKPVTPHSLGVLAGIPAFLGGLGALTSGSVLIGAVSIIGGIAVMAIIQTFLVPLVRTKITTG